MESRATQDALERYANVLRGFGLSVAEIRALHGLPDGAPLNLETVQRTDAFEANDGPITTADLESHLRSVVADSGVGIEAPRQYWNELPTRQLRAVVEYYGGTFDVREPTAASSAGDPVISGSTTLAITDPDSATARTTAFEYPDTALGNDNYPALLATIEAELLAGTPLTFVTLRPTADEDASSSGDGVDDVWLAALVDERGLDSLRDRYGERIEWAGEPLLAEHQPAAYDVDVPRAAEAPDGCPPELVPDPEAEFFSLASDSTASFDGVADEVDARPADANEPSEFDHGGVEGPSVDELLAAEDPSTVVDDAGPVAASDGGTVVMSDDDVDELFATVDETTLDEPAHADDGEPEAASEGADGGLADSTVDAETHALDAAFEDLNRTATAMSAGDRTGGDDDDVTSGDIIEELDHDNVGDDATVDDGFMWVDPEELTPVPGAVYDAAPTDI